MASVAHPPLERAVECRCPPCVARDVRGPTPARQRRDLQPSRSAPYAAPTRGRPPGAPPSGHEDQAARTPHVRTPRGRPARRSRAARRALSRERDRSRGNAACASRKRSRSSACSWVYALPPVRRTCSLSLASWRAAFSPRCERLYGPLDALRAMFQFEQPSAYPRQANALSRARRTRSSCARFARQAAPGSRVPPAIARVRHDARSSSMRPTCSSAPAFARPRAASARLPWPPTSGACLENLDLIQASPPRSALLSIAPLTLRVRDPDSRP